MRDGEQDPYGVSKSEAETALRRMADQTRIETVIIRPPLVNGPRVKGNFLSMLKVLSRGIPLPFRSVVNRRSLTYVGNFVDVSKNLKRFW
ncbi:MAG: NAD-dependent epimerase/dehydratase family protein [Pseudomonadota bacterium]